MSTQARIQVEDINALLPQTQCTRCGHDGCRPYARAIAEGEPINRCPPGGDETILRLAQLLGVPALPLDRTFGDTTTRHVAFIREAECIGCTKCIQVCPTDAILGAAKRMHSVIASECTGCELCLPACPVDCMEMRPLPLPPASQPHDADVDAGFDLARAQYWRSRHDHRQQRLSHLAALPGAAAARARTPTVAPARKSAAQLQQEIAAAVERAKARKLLKNND